MLNNKVLLSSTMICGGLLSALSLNSTNAKADMINSASSNSSTQSSDVILSSTTTSNSLKDKSNNNDANANSIDKSNTNISSNSLNDSQKDNELNKNSDLQVNSTSINNSQQNTNSSTKANNDNLSSASSSGTIKSNGVTNQNSNKQDLHSTNLSFAAIQDNSNNQEKSIKDIYDGQPIPIDSNGRVRTDLHTGTEQEEKEGRAYLEHNDNLPKAQYNSLQNSDKDAYNQYIKDRDAYNKELNDGKDHFNDYKKVLDEYNKLTNNGNKYPEDVVISPPCWWHGYNGWQSKENINKVWIASVGFISDTPDEDGGYLDIEPAYTLRHNGITGQNSLQYGTGLDYSGMPDGSSRCSNYIDKSGVLTIIPPKGYKFNVEASKKTEMLNYKYNGKPLVVSFTPDKIVFDFQVYADGGNQYIAPASIPVDGHPGYYQMTNNHFFQLVVTPINKESVPVQSVPNDADYYQDTIDWEPYIWPGGTSNFGKGDRRPGIIDRQILKMPLNGKDPKKMSNAERTYVVVAPAGWQFQNVRETKEYPAQWAPFEFNDVHDSYDSDWEQGDHLTRATIDDGTTNSLYATPDQAHIGFFDFNREFQGFKDSYKEAHDRLWLMPDQTWNGIKGQQHDKVFAEPIADTGASIDAKNMTVKLGDKTDFSKVNATDWMGKPTTAKLVKGSIDVNKPGKYSLTYENTNSFGIKSDKAVLITVQDNQQNNNSSNKQDNKPVTSNSATAKPSDNGSSNNTSSSNSDEAKLPAASELQNLKSIYDLQLSNDDFSNHTKYSAKVVDYQGKLYVVDKSNGIYQLSNNDKYDISDGYLFSDGKMLSKDGSICSAPYTTDDFGKVKPTTDNEIYLGFGDDYKVIGNHIVPNKSAVEIIARPNNHAQVTTWAAKDPSGNLCENGKGEIIAKLLDGSLVAAPSEDITYSIANNGDVTLTYKNDKSSTLQHNLLGVHGNATQSSSSSTSKPSNNNSSNDVGSVVDKPNNVTNRNVSDKGSSNTTANGTNNTNTSSSNNSSSNNGNANNSTNANVSMENKPNNVINGNVNDEANKDNSSKVSTNNGTNKDNSSKANANDEVNKDNSSKVNASDETNKDNSSKVSTSDETNKDNSSKANSQDGIAGDVDAKKSSATNEDEINNAKENSVTSDSDLNSKDTSSKIDSTANLGTNINSTNNQKQDALANDVQSKDALANDIQSKDIINSSQSKDASSNNQIKDVSSNSTQLQSASKINSPQVIKLNNSQSEVTKGNLSSQLGSSSNNNEDLPQSGDSKDEIIIAALLTLGLIGMTKFNKREE